MSAILHLSTRLDSLGVHLRLGRGGCDAHGGLGHTQSRPCRWKELDLFEREARILKALKHPNIPAYVDSFEVDSEKDRNYYLVQAGMPCLCRAPQLAHRSAALPHVTPGAGQGRVARDTGWPGLAPNRRGGGGHCPPAAGCPPVPRVPTTACGASGHQAGEHRSGEWQGRREGVPHRLWRRAGLRQPGRQPGQHRRRHVW